MSNKFWIYSLILTVLLASTAMAADSGLQPVIKIKKMPRFDLPIDCSINENCWVMNYVDFGFDDDKKTDPFCLSRTYDSHKGTDIALLDGAAMLRGVNVLAAADGTISRLRNSEEDGWHDQETLDQIRENQKECGNGIFIDHGNDVSTIYCHLKLNSITVKKGQAVKKGDKIAQVGQSGMTEFPHLHFGIIKNGKVLDPFTGQNNEGECGKKRSSLWSNTLDLAYELLTIQAVGFLGKAPDFNAIEREVPEISQIQAADGAMVFWVTLLGAREGDKIMLEIKDPNGDVFVMQDIEQEKTRARQFYYVGKKLKKENIVEGAYTGSVKVKRDVKDWHKTSAILLIK